LEHQRKNFLFIPVFADEEQNQTAYLLHVLLWTVIFAITIMELIDIIILPANTLRWLTMIAIVNPFSLALMFLSWRGHTRLAAFILIIGMTLFNTRVAMTGGGIRAPGFILSSGIVFGAGLLLGMRAGILMALVCSLIGLGLVWADKSGLLPNSNVHHTPLSIWANIVLNLIFIVFLQYLSVRIIKGLLRQAREEIADRKQAEEALRQSEENYRQLFEMESDALFLVEKASGRILDVNTSAVALYGYTKAEWLDLYDTDLSAAPEPNEKSTEQPLGPILVSLHRKKNGAVFPVEITASHFDYQGQKVHLAAIRDISDRKRAEETLRESEERFRTIFENSSDGILVVDDETKQIFFGNETISRMLQYDLDQLKSLTIQAIHPPEDWSHVLEQFEKLVHKEIAVSREIPVRRKDGSLLYADISAAAITINNKNYVSGFFRDITERKQAEEERRRLDAQMLQTQKLESLGVLAGGIAHDFNNMLMVVMGNADLVLQDLSEFSPARPTLAEIIKTANRASELCKQMLTYSGKSSSVMKTMNLSEAVEEMGQMIEFSISKKAVLHYYLSKNLPSIKADASQVRQIILNLIINASESLGAKEGSISVRTEVMECDRPFLLKEQLQDELREGFYVYLEVKDTGCGMDRPTLEKVFDLFFSTKFTGRGLGLSTVQGIVRNHGGAIKVYSKPGKGSIFKIFFPAAFVAADATFAKQAKKETWKGSGVVLLVEDEANIRTLCRRMLERIGFEVLAAADGRQALEIFRVHQDRIRCVLLDLTMPQMDGGETLIELRRIAPNLPVILSSGFSEQKISDRFKNQDLSGFLQKPYQQVDLRAALKKALKE
jgi:PAS domain S-box-containing protein